MLPPPNSWGRGGGGVTAGRRAEEEPRKDVRPGEVIPKEHMEEVTHTHTHTHYFKKYNDELENYHSEPSARPTAGRQAG